MAETMEIIEEQKTQTVNRPNEMTVNSEQLAGHIFDFEQPKKEEPKQESAVEVKTEHVKVEVKEEPKKEPEEEIIEEDEAYKREFGKTKAELKTEYEELRKLRESKPTTEEFKFENDESKRLAEAIARGDRKKVLSILDTQEKLESLTTSDITKDNAAEIIKLKMKLGNDRLTNDDIEFQYNQDFSIPKEPVQKTAEDDDDFKERHDEWAERVRNIEQKRVVAAKMAIPELEQAKSKLVLPEIQRPEVQAKQPTQEELEAMKKYDQAYIQSVDNSLKDFSGFSVSVKNEAVGLPEISVVYSVMDTEKNSLGQEMKDFVNAGYDANTLFAKNWVNDDGTLNTKQIAEDRYLLANKDKIFQKMTLDAATKAIDAFIKGKKNININEQKQQGNAQINKEDKTELDTVRDQFFG